LAANPKVLIFVEGIEKVNGETYWWGGNLAAAGDYPVVLSKPEKLVYSFHEYGPSVFDQPHFSDPNFPNNMPGIWNEKFDYLYQQGVSPLFMGEFGAKQAAGVERIWFENIMAFGGDRYSWTFWSWNPNSGDTGGLLDDNWSTIVSWKYNILQPHLAAEIPNGCSGGGPGNNAPVASISTDKTSGLAPLMVQFDASQSSDPDGDPLTYTWDFGDNTTATGVQVSHTFQSAQAYTVTLTVTDGQGATAIANVVITVQDTVTGGCGNLLEAFDMPRSTPLPTMSQATYEYAHVFGATNLDLSNLNNLTINWDNAPTYNELHQLSILTTDGVPSWWNDLKGKATHSFASVNPQLTFTGTGFVGLDGVYYVNLDAQGNFILVEQTGAYAIYFSNSSTPPFNCPNLRSTHQLSKIETSLKAFPNPVERVVSLRGIPKGKFYLRVYDNSGKLTITKRINSVNAITDINLERLSKGAYVILITGEKYYKQLRIIKE